MMLRHLHNYVGVSAAQDLVEIKAYWTNDNLVTKGLQNFLYIFEIRYSWQPSH